jgi:hypothetical protein
MLRHNPGMHHQPIPFPFRSLSSLGRALALACVLWPAAAVQAQDKPVYRCPGPPVLYTDAMSPQDARDKGCRTIEGAPITIVPATKPRTSAAASTPSVSGRLGDGNRVDPAEQRSRDGDAKRILNEELRREEDRLGQLRRDFNNGQPERGGDERNYQKYLDRVAEMKAAIARKEADIAAIRRELGKLPS